MSWKTLLNKEAPSVTLPDQANEPYAVEPGKTGKPLVLFFYPAAGSYGCTREACQFRDAISEKDYYKADKVTVVGISGDSVDKQKVFVDKQKLTFPVLSDKEGKARKAYNVGRGLFGLTPTARVTFIIDEKGVIRDGFESTINYGAHSKFVTQWLEKLEKEKEKGKGEAPKIETPPTEPAPAPAIAPEVAPVVEAQA
ncbi:hypothetical protein V5O48_003363 [Marasmius crinis-equi]|uniref:thioredoxin-dependent peroxiredoxin n=1 Tax=Marasmius crinis-equi TaxID=585013 RepID=A0ABR3FT06_9AGAR